MAVSYKKPRAINSVTFLLLGVVGLLAYVGWSLYPAFQLSSNVKSELLDALPHLYRANLRPEPAATQQIFTLRKTLYERLTKSGVRDKDLKLDMQRNKQKVAIEAQFSSQVTFKWIDKVWTIQHHPRVETEATRIDW